MPKKNSTLSLSETQEKEKIRTTSAPGKNNSNKNTAKILNTKSSTKSLNKNSSSSKNLVQNRDIGDILARYLLGDASFHVKKTRNFTELDFTKGLEKKENVRSSSVNNSNTNDKYKTKIVNNNDKNKFKDEKGRKNQETSNTKIKMKKSNIFERKSMQEMSRSFQTLDKLVQDFKENVSSVITKKKTFQKKSSVSILNLKDKVDQKTSKKILNDKKIINLDQKSSKKNADNISTNSSKKPTTSDVKKSITMMNNLKEHKNKGSFTLKSLIPLYKNDSSELKDKNILNLTKKEDYNDFLDELVHTRRLYLSEIGKEKKEIKDKKSNQSLKKFKKSEFEIDLNNKNDDKLIKMKTIPKTTTVKLVKSVKSICINTDLVGEVQLKFQEETNECEKIEIVDKNREILDKTQMFDKIVEVFDKRLPILDQKQEESLKMELFGKNNEMFDDKQLNFDFNNNKNEDLDKKLDGFYENPDLFDKQQKIIEKCNKIFENNPENLDKKQMFNKLQELFNQGHTIFDRVLEKKPLQIDIFVDKQEIFDHNEEIFEKNLIFKNENVDEAIEVFDKEEKMFDVFKEKHLDQTYQVFYQNNRKDKNVSSKVDFSDKDTEILDKRQILNKMQEVFDKNQEILNKTRQNLDNRNQKNLIDQIIQTEPIPLDLLSKKIPLEELLKPSKPIIPNENLRFSDPVKYKSEQYDVAIQQGIDLTKQSITEFFGLIQTINEKSGDDKIDLYEDTCGLKYAKNLHTNIENSKHEKLDKILLKNFEKVEYFLRMVMYYYKMMVNAKSSVDKIIQKRFV